jgi:hypothetical protein
MNVESTGLDSLSTRSTNEPDVVKGIRASILSYAKPIPLRLLMSYEIVFTLQCRVRCYKRCWGLPVLRRGMRVRSKEEMSKPRTIDTNATCDCVKRTPTWPSIGYVHMGDGQAWSLDILDAEAKSGRICIYACGKSSAQASFRAYNS